MLNKNMSHPAARKLDYHKKYSLYFWWKGKWKYLITWNEKKRTEKSVGKLKNVCQREWIWYLTHEMHPGLHQLGYFR